LKVTFSASDSASPLIGPYGSWTNGEYVLETKNPGEATPAELFGDIDGFNIGKRILGDPKKLLSSHIRDYYTNANRFQEFKQHTNYDLLKKQVNEFMIEFRKAQTLGIYGFEYKGCVHLKMSSFLAKKATNEFCARFRSELEDFGCP